VAGGGCARSSTRLLLGREGLMTVLTGYHFSKRNLIDACLQALPGATAETTS
jgi:hypothetical protein